MQIVQSLQPGSWPVAKRRGQQNQCEQHNQQAARSGQQADGLTAYACHGSCIVLVASITLDGGQYALAGIVDETGAPVGRTKPEQPPGGLRSEGRRVGTDSVSNCSSRESAYLIKKNDREQYSHK